MTRKKDSLVFGCGVVDVDYTLHKYKTVCGKRKCVWVCPYYEDWREMLRRCFCPNLKICRQTYLECTMYDDWKYLSKFIEWVDNQPNTDWKNQSLDKDFLFDGNKHYSPETCVYITKSLNSFIIDRANDRGKLHIGVTIIKDSKKNPYRSECSNPFTRKREYLGLFPTELEAHKAWQAKKHEYACALADLQQDPRVAKVLRERYAPDKDWTNK